MDKIQEAKVQPKWKIKTAFYRNVSDNKKTKGITKGKNNK